MDIPTDCPHREKRGWTGDSLAAHETVSAFFDMRAAWTKWVDDMLFTQEMMGGVGGNMPSIVPCIFDENGCNNDPRHPGRAPSPPDTVVATDVAWGSVLPLLGAYTARLTNDARFASRAAAGAAAYVQMLHAHANAETSAFPGLLNYTGWPGTRLGDWCPVKGSPMSVSSLLNSHHLILDIDAVAILLQQVNTSTRWLDDAHNHHVDHGILGDQSSAPELPSPTVLVQWAATARSSFAKAFLHNITVPTPGGNTTNSTCGVALEKEPVTLSCNGGTIVSVAFAGYGVPNGTCASGLRPSSACYLDVTREVLAACVGRSTCTVECTLAPHLRVCAGVNVSDPCGGVVKHLSVSVTCSASPAPSPSPAPIVGLAFRDLYPPLGNNDPPQAQTEAGAGMAAMDFASEAVVDDHQRVALGDMLVALVANPNKSSTQKATVTGGIIDMTYLVPQLISHGHPDVAFDVRLVCHPACFFSVTCSLFSACRTFSSATILFANIHASSQKSCLYDESGVDAFFLTVC